VGAKKLADGSEAGNWKGIERGIAIEDFRIDNVPARVRKLGDLWKPLNEAKGRFKLEAYL
jgi:bifunctional non-homologous end joining protein LigD